MALAVVVCPKTIEHEKHTTPKRMRRMGLKKRREPSPPGQTLKGLPGGAPMPGETRSALWTSSHAYARRPRAGRLGLNKPRMVSAGS